MGYERSAIAGGLVADVAGRHINTLSDGEKRRAALALALAGQPRLS